MSFPMSFSFRELPQLITGFKHDRNGREWVGVHVRNQENREDRRSERSSGGIDDPPENPDTIRLTVCEDSAVRDEGTVICLQGLDSRGNLWWFACDRRM